jgi:hypothetical protein
VKSDNTDDVMDEMKRDRELSRRELINSRVCELFNNWTLQQQLSNSSTSLSSLSFDYLLLPNNATTSYYWAMSLLHHFSRLPQLENFQNISSIDKRLHHHSLRVIKYKCMQGNNANVGLRHTYRIEILW